METLIERSKHAHIFEDKSSDRKCAEKEADCSALRVTVSGGLTDLQTSGSGSALLRGSNRPEDLQRAGKDRAEPQCSTRQPSTGGTKQHSGPDGHTQPAQGGNYPQVLPIELHGAPCRTKQARPWTPTLPVRTSKRGGERWICS